VTRERSSRNSGLIAEAVLGQVDPVLGASSSIVVLRRPVVALLLGREVIRQIAFGNSHAANREVETFRSIMTWENEL
jgi:hypothetical protein